MASRTAARLADAFLVYLIGVTLLVTLLPFDFALPGDFHVLLGGSVADTIANVMMFVPLGFLYRLTRMRERDAWAVGVLGAAMLFSFGIETAQLFLPSRTTAPLDVLANGLGGWLGALGHDQIVRRLRLTPALVGALALELPLMGLVYLLIPLLWLSGLAASDDRGRLLLSLVLGLIGSVALGAVYRHRLGPSRAVSRRRFAVIAALWFLVGALPGLVVQPAWVLIAALAVALSTALWSMEPLPAEGPERRFEGETLGRLAPVFALYLAFLAGWPPWSEWTPFHGDLSSALLWGETSTIGIIRVLEQLASFTVLGYLVAESRGRLEQSYRASLGPLLAVGAGSALFVELVAALHPGPGASPLRGVLAVAIACYGGSIYHLQRSHIRYLLRGERVILPLRDGTDIEPARVGRLPINALLSDQRQGTPPKPSRD